MRISEVKQELESYGITVEKYVEMVLQETLKECRTDVFGSSTTASYVYKYKTKQDQRLEGEVAKCEKMKNLELKKELKERGVSTASLLERSQFVYALAKARLKAEDDKDVEHKMAEILPRNHEGPRPKGHGRKNKDDAPHDHSKFYNNGGAHYRQASGNENNNNRYPGAAGAGNRQDGGSGKVHPFEPNFTM